MKRIAIIGNGGGGKTTLARRLGRALHIPVNHVDSIQYQPGWRRTPKDECDLVLAALTEPAQWIIDGFGSDESIQSRLRAADTVIFVDFPLWRHYLWAMRRQVGSFWRPRSELPERCPEFTFSYTWKLIKVMWEVHQEFRPWLLEQLAGLPESVSVFHLRSPKEWRHFSEQYCPAESGAGYGALIR